MGLAEEAAEVMLAEDEDDDDDADDAPVALVWHSYSASSSSWALAMCRLYVRVLSFTDMT